MCLRGYVPVQTISEVEKMENEGKTTQICTDIDAVFRSLLIVDSSGNIGFFFGLLPPYSRGCAVPLPGGL